MNKLTFVKNIFGDEASITKYKGFVKYSWSITWPILMIMFFSMIMNMTDVYVSGLIGKTTQAAVGLANQTYYIFTVVEYAITIGTIAVISKIFAAENRGKNLSKAVFSAVCFAGVASLIITLIAYFAAGAVIARFDMDEEVKSRAVELLKMYCAGLFFNLMMLHFNGILRACMMVRYSMVVMVAASVINIFLTVYMTFYTSLGFLGIALASSVCWFLAFIITLPVVCGLMKEDRSLSVGVIKKIFSISWPSGIVAFSWQVSAMALYTIVGKLGESSVEVMAAMTAGLRIEAIIYMPAFAFNMANAVVVGSLLGEGKKDSAFEAGLATTLAGVSVVILLTLAVIASAVPISGILASKSDGGMVDAGVFRETVRYLRIVMISEPFMAFNMIMGGALSGAGDTRSLMRYSLFSLWVLRIPFAYIFAVPLGFGAVAIWWAMNITFFSLSFLSGRRFFSKKWLK